MSNFMENRYKIAKIIAAVASVFGVIGLANFFEILHLGAVGEFRQGGYGQTGQPLATFPRKQDTLPADADGR